jgi:RNA polymerase sigma-70 factor (ECF subfamily)
MGAAPRAEARTDDELLRAARLGDDRALGALVARYEPRVYRFSYRLTGNADDAADVSQDTLMAMARSLKSFRGESALTTWLYTVARRFAMRRYRQRARQRSRETALEDIDNPSEPRLRSAAPTPEDLTVALERDAAINAALRRLSPSHRDVLLLRDVEGLTAPEASKVLGIGVRAVKSRLHRARLSLRATLAPLVGADVLASGKPGCQDIVAQFSKSLDGELGPATCAELEAHLGRCRGCREACASLKKVLAVCRQAPARDLPAALKRSLQRAVRQAALAQRELPGRRA